jgi:hypothetical protein
MRRTLFVSLSLVLLSCGGEGTGGNSNSDGKGESKGTVDATIEGQGGVSLKGEAASPIPKQFAATVAAGELAVYLAGADGAVVFFRIDMSKKPLPNKVPPGASLADPAFLTVTTPTGIFESGGAGGEIIIDQCPDASGKEITGSFQNVTLKNPLGGQNKLTGNFKVVVSLHDGTHKCTGSKPQPKGPPGCSVAVCDGPCCPYQACMTSCLTGCVTTSCKGMDVMGCFNCMNGCPDKCNVSGECRSCLEPLNDCAQKHQCDPAPPEESPCVGQHCCSEFKACF